MLKEFVEHLFTSRLYALLRLSFESHYYYDLAKGMIIKIKVNEKNIDILSFGPVLEINFKQNSQCFYAEKENLNQNANTYKRNAASF